MAAELDNHNARSYLLGDCTLEPEKRRLTRNGAVIPLSNKPLQVLLYLIEHRTRVVTRQDLLEQFWDGKDVYDDSLRKSVGAIRKALDEDASGERFIETHYGEGYRYVGPLEEVIVEYAPTAFEIEKTRGVRIVIEEEDSQSPDKQAAAARLGGLTDTVTSRRLLSSVALGFILVAVALAAVALLLLNRNQTARSSNHPPAAIRSIAVLPLANLSGDADSDYFADGLTENFITRLSNIPGLKVISRSSVFTYKGKAVEPRDVGRRLGVQAVMEGSVRRNGDTVRVETRLVNTEDGSVIWAGSTFDRALKDIFAVQDEISCSVAANLRVTLCSERETYNITPYTENVGAYDALLKSRYYCNRRRPRRWRLTTLTPMLTR